MFLAGYVLAILLSLLFLWMKSTPLESPADDATPDAPRREDDTGKQPEPEANTSWEERAVLSGHEFSPSSVAFSPDGKTLASCEFALGQPTAVKVWDVESGRERLSWEMNVGGFQGICFSPDGKTLATAGTKHLAHLWDAETGRQRAVLPRHPGMVGCVAFSPAGESLVTAGGTEASGEVHCWDAKGRTERWSLKTPHSLVRCLAFSPDGKTLATGEGASKPGHVVLRDAATGKERADWVAHEQDVFAVVFSPDGKTLASCGKERVAKLWDIATREERVIIRQKTGWIRSLAFSPDGDILALACGEYDPASRRASGDVRLWDVAAEREQPPLRGRRGYLTTVAFSPDGKLLAAGGEGSKIVLWRRLPG